MFHLMLCSENSISWIFGVFFLKMCTSENRITKICRSQGLVVGCIQLHKVFGHIVFRLPLRGRRANTTLTTLKSQYLPPMLTLFVCFSLFIVTFFFVTSHLAQILMQTCQMKCHGYMAPLMWQCLKALRLACCKNLQYYLSSRGIILKIMY